MSEKETSEIYFLDEVLEMIKLGVFHYRLLLLCGFAFMADALEVNLLSFLSTCAGAEWHLSDAQKASISSVVFAGIIIGSFCWGPIADFYGRKTSFVLASLLISIASFLTAAAPNFGWLLFFRSIVGFGIGGANVPFDLLAEMMPVQHRGRFLIYIEYFWTIGSMFVSAVAWLFMDAYGWRVVATITAIPVAITSAISIFYLPESPHWLLSVGREEDAKQVVKDAAALNGVSLPPFSFQHENREKLSVEHYLRRFLEIETLRYTIPLWAVWMLFGFTYYGVILFVGRVYSNSSSDDDSGGTCSFDYESIFINAVAELGGVTMSALFLERTGRVRLQVIFYIASGLTVFFMGFPLPDWLVLFVSMISRMCVMTASVSVSKIFSLL
jgi:MFS family permease